MEKITVDRNNPGSSAIETIANYFQQGAVVAYPADTIYGLGCIATNKKAIERIHEIKERPVDKPLLTLIKDQQMLDEYFVVTEEQKEYLQGYWPGPFSFLLQSKGRMAVDAEQEEQTVVARLPKSDFLIKIIERVGVPITSTSLNLTGEETIQTVDKIENSIPTKKIDLLVDGGRLSGEASSIIDLRDVNNIKKIR